MHAKLRSLIRPLFRALSATYGFAYDLWRYLKFSGYRENRTDSQVHAYLCAKASHGLEKSMSFTKKRPRAAWAKVERLSAVIEGTSRRSRHDADNFQVANAVSVVQAFLAQDGNMHHPGRERMMATTDKHEISNAVRGGSLQISRDDLLAGKLSDPSRFFRSRRSVRAFNPQASVEPDLLEMAIELAMTAPSACNRQEWHVYVVTEKGLKERCLALQNGNEGFGADAPVLLIVATDLKAFGPSLERYQHYVDGGIFAGFVTMALHSVGLASCCLNWSQTPGRDMKLRKLLPIVPSHTIITMMAVGYPIEGAFSVCASTRRPAQDVITKYE